MTDQPAGSRAAQYVGVGCLMTAAGFFGGGMLGVFVGMIVGNFQGCTPPEGLPICNIERYWVPGMLIGAVLLPAVTLWRLRQSRVTPTKNSN